MFHPNGKINLVRTRTLLPSLGNRVGFRFTGRKVEITTTQNNGNFWKISKDRCEKLSMLEIDLKHSPHEDESREVAAFPKLSVLPLVILVKRFLLLLILALQTISVKN